MYNNDNIEKEGFESEMEVIICSKDKRINTKLMFLTDKIISKNHLRLMSLYSEAKTDIEEFTSKLKPDTGYLIILDITMFKEWWTLIRRVTEKNKNVSILLLSNTNTDAVKAINMFLNVCGYVNKRSKTASADYQEILESIYGRIRTVCGGLMSGDAYGGIKIIPYNDIYYIETIKQTHKCTIYHKNGTDVIRADISKLIQDLDIRFCIARPSSIVNISNIESMEDRNIRFCGSLCCTASSKNYSEIKKNMRIQYII